MGVVELILGILAAIAGGTSAAVNIAKSKKQGKAAEEQKDFQEKSNKFNELEDARRARETRRQALARAVGSDIVTMPYESGKGPEAPRTPDLSGYDMASGLSSVIGQGAGLAGDLAGQAQAGATEGAPSPVDLADTAGKSGSITPNTGLQKKSKWDSYLYNSNNAVG